MLKVICKPRKAPWNWIAYYGNSCWGTWFDIIQNRSHFKDQILSDPFKHETSNYLETVVFRFKIFNKQMKQKSKHNFNKKYKNKFLLISLALFPMKWFWNTEVFPSNEFKVNFLRRNLKVGFKAFNLVEDSTVLKESIKCCQH